MRHTSHLAVDQTAAADTGSLGPTGLPQVPRNTISLFQWVPVDPLICTLLGERHPANPHGAWTSWTLMGGFQDDPCFPATLLRGRCGEASPPGMPSGLRKAGGDRSPPEIRRYQSEGQAWWGCCRSMRYLAPPPPGPFLLCSGHPAGPVHPGTAGGGTVPGSRGGSPVLPSCRGNLTAAPGHQHTRLQTHTDPHIQRANRLVTPKVGESSNLWN